MDDARHRLTRKSGLPLNEGIDQRNGHLPLTNQQPFSGASFGELLRPEYVFSLENSLHDWKISVPHGVSARRALAGSKRLNFANRHHDRRTLEQTRLPQCHDRQVPLRA